MAISTDSAIEFFGTQTTITSGTSAITPGSFASAGTWTNTDDAPVATMILESTFAAVPTANIVVDLYARLLNIQSTNDQEIPTANYQHRYLGSFPVKDQSTIQRTAIDVGLPNVDTQQEYEFYIRNNDDIDNINAGWNLYITPKTFGPHA